MRRALISMLMFAAAATAGATTLKETVEKSFNVRPRTMLSLTTVNGRVSVKAGNDSRVIVRAEKQVKSRDEDAARRVMRELKIEIQQTADRLSINTVHPRKSSSDFGIWDFLLGTEANSQVRYELTIPREMNVSLRTVNGSITIDGVTGELELDTTNGAVEVADCAGSLDASTTNGGVRAELLSVTRGKDVRIETTNGRIEVALPPGLAADVDAGTTNGKIESGMPMSVRSSGRNRLRGTLNGGGAIVKLRTTNGGIEIRSTASASQASR